MRETIQEKVNRIEDLEQRKLLKNIVMGAFISLLDYQEESLKNLEERVFSEIEDAEERYSVYFTAFSSDETTIISSALRRIY
ncbi:MAG TPA: hypothetical protein VHO90_15565 [Bacteroidales bacterium]|nr:hypothetical protein [Bacteroidales bacterium]